MSTSSFSSFAVIHGVLKTFDERVYWAINHEKLCVFHDHDEIIPGWRLPRTYAKNASREFITSLQECYEKAYNETKKELERRKIRQLEELDTLSAEQYPDLGKELGSSSNIQSPGLTHASIEPSRKKCKERLDRCHEQDPVMTSCRECQVEGQAHTFNSGMNEDDVGNDEAQSCDTDPPAIANLTAEVVEMRQTQEQIVEGIWLIADKVNALAMDNTSEQISIAARVDPCLRRNRMPNEDLSNGGIHQNLPREDSMLNGGTDTMEDLADHLLKPIAYRRTKRKASIMACQYLLDDGMPPIAHREVKRKSAMNYYNVLDAHKQELFETQSTETE